MRSRFIAYNTTRVRLSGAKLTDAVRGKGSGLMVTDSSATARVDVASLINTGDLGTAWTIVQEPTKPMKTTYWLAFERRLRDLRQKFVIR
jgi:hypothetical protein